MKYAVLILIVFCISPFCAGNACAETIESADIASAEATAARSFYVLMIIPQYNFVDDEYTIPKVILSRAGHTVEVASASTREIALGTDIIKVRPNLTIDQIDTDKYGAVIFVGGYLSKKFYENPILIEKTRQFQQKGKLIGAMDNIPYFLAQWGLLKDKKATVNPSLAKAFVKMGANYVQKDIVIDEDLITVNTASFSDAFANEVVDELKKR